MPGVTTICGRIKKTDALIPWALKLAREGKSHTEERDRAGRIGTLAHEMVEAHLLSNTLDFASADSKEVEIAMTAYSAWLDWWTDTSSYFSVVDLEVSMLSREYGYGGTLDALMRDKTGRLWLMDWKTSNGIYADALMQLAGYIQLIKECGDETPTHVGIVNFTKAGRWEFLSWTVEEIEVFRELFLIALSAYKRDARAEKVLKAGYRQSALLTD